MKKIKFNGGIFGTETDLVLFQGTDRMSMVYGKNGSGKSTITKAILKAKGEDIPDVLNAKLYDLDDNEIIDSSHIHVYNEDYINSRVKICDDGLNAIVLLGELGKIEEDIEKTKKEIMKEKDFKEKQEEICAKYKNSDSPESPLYFKNKITLGLAGDTRWSGREKLINNGKRNASVNENTINSILATKVTLSETELKKEYSEKMELLTQVRKNEAEKITNTKQLKPAIEVKELTELLKKQLQKPELNSREQYLLKLIEQGKGKQLEDMKDVFDSEKTTFCPFCLQRVEEDYKSDLVKSIQLVLSKEVDTHKANLREYLQEEIFVDFEQYRVLSSENLLICEKVIQEINEEINRVNGIIQKKIDNPYSPLEDFYTTLDILFEKYENGRRELEKEIEQYNNVINNTQKLIQELQRINKELARVEVAILYESYIKLVDLERKEQQKLIESKERLSSVEKKLDNYNAQKKNIDIAVGLINKSLRYVFFSKDRLEIRVEADKYKLYSNGLPVKPNNVSVGERNIIALCYFFTELITNRDAKDGYSQKMILVIDDPVSSFDFENKVGIMSLLKSKFSQIMLDNDESKIIVFTHDIQCMYDLQKIAEEICEEYKLKNGGRKIKFAGRELKNKNIDGFAYEKRHEYSELIKLVYDYATENTNGIESTIGNTMRRVLEAFSTFLYKKGIDKVSCDPNILKLLKDTEYIDYFKNLMYRLVLNGESHMLERTKGLEDIEYLEYMSEESKLRTAREILCFMYLLNKEHVLAHLEEKEMVSENIEVWCNNIKQFQQLE